MATSKESEEGAIKYGDMFAVHPKNDCPHVQPLVADTETLNIDISIPCKSCQNKEENWLCLRCSEVHCSRYVSSHMVEHNEYNPTHVIALSFSDLSFWCYECDSYIESPCLSAIYEAASISKFDTPNVKLKPSSSDEPGFQKPESASSNDGENDKKSPQNEKDVIKPESTAHEGSQTSEASPNSDGGDDDEKSSQNSKDASQPESATPSGTQTSEASPNSDGGDDDEKSSQNSKDASQPESATPSGTQTSEASPNNYGDDDDEKSSQNPKDASQPESATPSGTQTSEASPNSYGDDDDEKSSQNPKDASQPESATPSGTQTSEASPNSYGDDDDEKSSQNPKDASQPESATPSGTQTSEASPNSGGGHDDKKLFQNPKGASQPESATPSGTQTSANSNVFHLESCLPKEVLLSRMRAVIYGNCIGDAIGLLTEFMTKEEAREIYGTVEEKKYLGLKTSRKAIKYPMLEYENKIDDFHRSRWMIGDWTDDSDQMILILRTLLDNNGKANYLDFVQKFKVWTQTGYKELGDFGGMGIGQTTFNVILQKDFLENPHKCAYQVWNDSGRWAAPNGGVMRTSVLGIQDFSDIPTVIKNTGQICKVTHADPRCIASCVAVTTAIALMLQGKHCKGKESYYQYDVKKICDEAYEYACGELETPEQKEELSRHMFAENLAQLELSVDNKIGYTYKCLGAGFWAFRQEDFRKALTELVMEAGDADTNGAVAGALLGCKLGVEKLPDSWLSSLCYKDWLDDHIDRYLSMLGVDSTNKKT